MADRMIPNDILDETSALAIAVADLAKKAIGPNGRVYRMPEDGDAQTARAAFVARLAEVATGLANGEDVSPAGEVK